MQTVTIWHNPRCSKSREAINILEKNNIKADVVKYLDKELSTNDIQDILKLLKLSPRELMRTSEDIYKELNLKEETNDNKLILAMAKNPKLIQRPILIKNDSAIIGRPTERIAEFLNS
ncbi:MAG: arsenate reductase (glutaredoxin) [Sulfurimonas sp.]|nr:MAG: arsenate reductase (glutaredoxin) [Sulfurimonas sp.]